MLHDDSGVKEVQQHSNKSRPGRSVGDRCGVSRGQKTRTPPRFNGDSKMASSGT